ncbi:MAG: hypothetical protein KAT07_05745 [Calditrichia bacterium]|nr:hypothetical protein [Calditrichia bacterium]
MRTYILEKESFINESPEEVFTFFSSAENLEKVTSVLLHFEILTPLPIEMHAGCIIDYRLKIYRIPFLWRPEITV